MLAFAAASTFVVTRYGCLQPCRVIGHYGDTEVPVSSLKDIDVALYVGGAEGGGEGESSG